MYSWKNNKIYDYQFFVKNCSNYTTIQFYIILNDLITYKFCNLYLIFYFEINRNNFVKTKNYSFANFMFHTLTFLKLGGIV